MRENKTRLTVHHFMSAHSDNPSHLFSSSCLSHRDTIKMQPSFSCDLSFSPLSGLSQIAQCNLSTSASPGQGHYFVKPRMDRTHTHNTAHPWVRHKKWDKHLVVERQKKIIGQINLPSFHHPLVPVKGCNLCNKLNSCAAFEYRDCSPSVWF